MKFTALFFALVLVFSGLSPNLVLAQPPVEVTGPHAATFPEDTENCNDCLRARMKNCPPSQQPHCSGKQFLPTSDAEQVPEKPSSTRKSKQ
jgi:hypothetical protein